MARRASTSFNPVWVVLLLVAFVFTAGIGYYVFQMVNDIYRTEKPLEVNVYMNNANSLRGNNYKVEGTIANLLSWNPDEGRLFSLEVLDPAPYYIPIFVPPEFNDISLQKGQEYSFLVHVKDKGILNAKDLRKI